MFEELYLADISSIIRGSLRRAVLEGSIKGRIGIHSSVIAFFETRAREGIELGLSGLKELSMLRKEVELKDDVEIEYIREMPRNMKYAKDTLPDAIVRDLAHELNAVLVTSSPLLYETAKSLGIRTIFLSIPKEELLIDKFFEDNAVMSVHLKEGVRPLAKKGTPGNWEFIVLRKDPLTREELDIIVQDLVEYTRDPSKKAFIEVERPGSTIIQTPKYRVIITKPPFSDALEVTAVRHIVNLRLEDYDLHPKLIERLEKQAEGILIAGAPGMGKTTFAQALAEYYYRKGRIVKTIESPRDMKLPPEVTQYSKNYASSEEIHDVLLLSRPDYTFFDEMRDTKDFELYADLRLAGVGMVGVVHATAPIDAIQRFIGRVELGMIPSIIDTVIFIRNGRVEKVYELETAVKIPHGLREVDLARPVVVVKDFLTGQPEYEIYVFGERTFVVPIRPRESYRETRIKNAVEKVLRKHLSNGEFEIQVTSDGRVLVYVDPEYYNMMLGKPRKKLQRLGKRLGVEVDLRPRF